MQQWLFWEILASRCLSQWSTDLVFFIGLEKNIPPSEHTFKQTTDSELNAKPPSGDSYAISKLPPPD